MSDNNLLLINIKMVTGYNLGTGGVNYNPIGSGTIGILNPINGKDKYIKIAIGGIVNKKPQQSIEVKTLKSPKNPNGLEIDDLKTALSFVVDTKAGSGLDELKKAYSKLGYSPKLTEENFNYIKSGGGEQSSSGMGAIAGGAAGTYLGGKILKTVGRTIYKDIGGIAPTQQQALQMKEGRTAFQKFFGIKPEGASLEDVRTTTDTALERGGIFKQSGGNIQRATTATQTAKRVWRKEVTPIIKKIKDNFNIDTVTKYADDYADNMPNVFKGTDYKNGIKEVIDQIKQTYGKTVNLSKMSAQQIQDLRSHIMKMDIPQSAYRGVEVKESYKQGAIAFINGLKKTLIDGAKKTGADIKKFQKAYDDYGNLIDLSETAAKKAGTIPSQNLQQIISSTSGKPLSAISTVLGKGIYKIGQGLEFPVQKALDVGKKILKATGKGLKSISPTLKTLDPTGILINQIETEIKGKNLKGYQINNFSALRLMGKSVDEAVKEAEKTDPNKFTQFN